MNVTHSNSLGLGGGTFLRGEQFALQELQTGVAMFPHRRRPMDAVYAERATKFEPRRAKPNRD
jgi:hypothetical protein